MKKIAEQVPHLVGIKHADTQLELITELLIGIGPEFRIFCGLEALSLPMLVLGGSGLMNAVGNLAPARVAALYTAVQNGELDPARRIHTALFELNQSIFFDTNPIPLKYMMWRLGLLDAPAAGCSRGPSSACARGRCDRHGTGRRFGSRRSVREG